MDNTKSRKAPITVVIPVRNCASTLQRCSESVLSQTLTPEKVLVVYDESSDNSLEVIQKLIKRFPELFEMIRGPGQGLGAARQTAIRAVKTEYIAFLDGDDWYSKDALEILYTNVIKTGAACGVVVKVSLDNQESISFNPPHDFLVDNATLRKSNIIPISSTIYRTSLLRRVGGADGNLIWVEDYDIHLRVTQVTKYYFTNRIILYYSVPNRRGLLWRALEYSKWEAIVWLKHGFINWRAILRVLGYSIINMLLIPFNLLRRFVGSNTLLFREEYLRIFIGYIQGLVKGYRSE